MSAPHPSRYELECLHCGALAGDDRPRVSLHIAQCPECRAYLDELDAERARFEASGPALAGAAPLRATAPRRSFWSLRRSLIVGGALAAAVTLALTAPLARHLRDDGLRTMGPDVSPTVFIKSGSVVRPLAGEVAEVTAGDAARVVLRSESPGSVVVFFVDEHGAVSWLVPTRVDAPALLVGAGETALPGSAVFDAGPSRERLVLIFGSVPLAPADEVEAVLAARQHAPGVDFADASWLPARPDRRLFSVLFTRPRP